MLEIDMSASLRAHNTELSPFEMSFNLSAGGVYEHGSWC